MRKFWKILGGIVLALFLMAIFFFFRFSPAKSPEWGLTFSYREAQGLGFDWRTAYLDMLSDLRPKNLRLMTYWEDIEKDRGHYDFAIIDEMLSQAQKQNINVLLVVGRKQPRWPECHEPGWYDGLSSADKDQAVLDFVKATVNHAKTYTAIKSWQVENEPYFGFGDSCPVITRPLFESEVTLVKSLDTRPVVVTDSGDRGSWFWPMHSGADNFGFTLYRLSYDDKYGGYYKYPLPPQFYRVRAGILETFTKVSEISDVELQLEPWFTSGALNMPLDEQKALMNPKVFAENISFAKKTGIGKHYLWGVEWWYWMAKKNNDWGMWDAAKQLLAG
jgi:hypothetical protein